MSGLPYTKVPVVNASPGGVNNIAPFKRSPEPSFSTVKPSDLPELSKYFDPATLPGAVPKGSLLKRILAASSGGGFLAANILPFVKPLERIDLNDTSKEQPKAKDKYWKNFYYQINFKAGVEVYGNEEIVNLETQQWGPLYGVRTSSDPRYWGKTSIDFNSGGPYSNNGEPGDAKYRWSIRGLKNPGSQILRLFDFEVYKVHNNGYRELVDFPNLNTAPPAQAPNPTTPPTSPEPFPPPARRLPGKNEPKPFKRPNSPSSPTPEPPTPAPETPPTPEPSPEP